MINEPVQNSVLPRGGLRHPDGKTKMCPHFQKNRCFYPESCNFAHDISELRHDIKMGYLPGHQTGSHILTKNFHSFDSARFRNAQIKFQQPDQIYDSSCNESYSPSAATFSTAPSPHNTVPVLYSPPHHSIHHQTFQNNGISHTSTIYKPFNGNHYQQQIPPPPPPPPPQPPLNHLSFISPLPPSSNTHFTPQDPSERSHFQPQQLSSLSQREQHELYPNPYPTTHSIYDHDYNDLNSSPELTPRILGTVSQYNNNNNNNNSSAIYVSERAMSVNRPSLMIAGNITASIYHANSEDPYSPSPSSRFPSPSPTHKIESFAPTARQSFSNVRTALPWDVESVSIASALPSPVHPHATPFSSQAQAHLPQVLPLVHGIPSANQQGGSTSDLQSHSDSVSVHHYPNSNNFNHTSSSFTQLPVMLNPSNQQQQHVRWSPTLSEFKSSTSMVLNRSNTLTPNNGLASIYNSNAASHFATCTDIAGNVYNKSELMSPISPVENKSPFRVLDTSPPTFTEKMANPPGTSKSAYDGDCPNYNSNICPSTYCLHSNNNLIHNNNNNNITNFNKSIGGNHQSQQSVFMNASSNTNILQNKTVLSGASSSADFDEYEAGGSAAWMTLTSRAPSVRNSFSSSHYHNNNNNENELNHVLFMVDQNVVSYSNNLETSDAKNTSSKTNVILQMATKINQNNNYETSGEIDVEEALERLFDHDKNNTSQDIEGLLKIQAL